MFQYYKPTIFVSKCLEFERCRYNGDVIPNKLIAALDQHVRFMPICPEMEIGLGTPRDPIRLIKKDGQNRLVQPASKKDVTEDMLEFSDKLIAQNYEFDGFILKAKSPSCGLFGVKLYSSMDEKGGMGKTRGLFAEKILKRYHGLAIEDEGRLNNYNIRHAFFTKIYAHSYLRNILKRESISDLMNFHSEYKYLFMLYSPQKLNQLGKIIARYDKTNYQEIQDAYYKKFLEIFDHLPYKPSYQNVFEHVLGYFKDHLTSEEKSFFIQQMNLYNENKLPVVAIKIIFQTWLQKYDIPYIKKQYFFQPYPLELQSVNDSGKGRENLS